MVGPPRKRARRDDKPEAELPQKKFYRQRAHANPFSDHDLKYPESPAAMDWSKHYPAYVATSEESQTATAQETSESTTQLTTIPKMSQQVEAAAAASKLGNKDMIAAPGVDYQNVSCIRANTMKFLPNFFTKHQLSKIFLCFPDPHFKARKHKARIVSHTLNAEYAYALRPGGKVYTITDVEDLHNWMVERFEAHPSFEKVGDEEVEADECVAVMREETEEGKKVTRNGGRKFVAVFRRGEDPEWP